MNTNPLSEMTLDSIQQHPIKEDRKILVLYKKRGNATNIQSLRHSKTVKKEQTVLADVVIIVEHIIKVNRPLREEIDSDQVFVYKSKGGVSIGQINNILKLNYTLNMQKWVKANKLKDDNGKPLRVNISRFRKTFTNRIWELTGGDPFVTAALTNHSVKINQNHYLEAPKEAVKNFHFMGNTRTRELLSTVEIIENNTPVSKCSKPPEINKDGKNNYCTDFLKCVRCRNMIVTKEDLYRLFSYYWLLVSERENIGAKKWGKYFAHIIRIIDREIAPQFDDYYVKTIKKEAKIKPHPAWNNLQQLEVVS